MVLQWAPTAPGRGHEDGRALLRSMYEALTGRPMPEILTEPRGKPYFAGGDVHFSISHTDRAVFCVLHDRPVGLDAEPVDRPIDLRLAEKILSPGERVRYEAASEPRLALLKLWVLKEASAKATGEGLRGYPRDTELSPDDPRLQTLHGHIVAIIEK